jgi:hypothetical protein
MYKDMKAIVELGYIIGGIVIGLITIMSGVLGMVKIWRWIQSRNDE